MSKTQRNYRPVQYIKANKRKSVIVLFVLLFAVSGLYLLMQSRAATPAVSFEPEKGSVAFPATNGTDSGASNNGYIQFNKQSNQVTETWGDHMGISGEINRTNIDKVKSLGLKWIKFSSERGWSFDYSLIDYAHSKGIKVIETCQQTVNGKHTYSSSDVFPFAQWCASWVDRGVDAIEIGNEWNHEPFWVPKPNGNYSLQALLSDVTTQAIRDKSATIPILNSGYSPESSPDLPQQALGKLLDASNGQFKTKANRIGHHAYAYNCDSPLKCEYDTGKPYNTFLQTQDLYKVAKQKGFDHPVIITELGGPSGNGTNEYTGKPFTPATQQQLYQDYLCGLALLRGGGIPIDLAFWHTIRDGESSTNAAELTFGIYDANWNLKKSGELVKAQAALPWSSLTCARL